MRRTVIMSKIFERKLKRAKRNDYGKNSTYISKRQEEEDDNHSGSKY